MKKKYKCFVCQKEIDEEEAWSFKGHIVHRGECIKKLCDEDNAVRKLQQAKDNLQKDYQEAVDKIDELQQENKQLKEALLDIKELQDNYLEEIYKGNVDLRLASSTLCKIDNIVNKALGDKENE